jgi:hypothetical protein
MPNAPDLATRRPVWLALSTMFLDADVAITRAARSQVLADSPLSLDELEAILIDEVYPVCWANLNAPNGECVGFDPLWLQAMILGRGASPVTMARLQQLARLAIPESTEWLATRLAVTTLRGATGDAAAHARPGTRRV